MSVGEIPGLFSAVAAAAEEDNEREYDYPRAVIIEKMA